jgi:hypothetical protein
VAAVQRVLSRLTILLFLAALGACAGGLRPPASGAGAPVAEAAVERFLQLAGEQEYLQMGWYFGTAEGPVNGRDEPSNVEKRMYALASVLQNNGYVIGAGSPVPGRVGAAQQFPVRLMQNGQQRQVPFTVVRGPGERWLVEQIDVQALTTVR